MQLFAETLARLRMGEPEAVREFVAKYEPYIRRSIRRRLSGTPLQAAADSVDVCQSALGSFLIRCAAGEFAFDNVEAMEHLIFTIAQRKLFVLSRRESAQRRDRKRTVAWDDVCEVAADSSSDPQWRVISDDLLEQVDRRLSVAEQRLFRMRRQGVDWETIAEADSVTAVVLRKRLSRALRRAALDLGVDLDDV